MLNEKEKDLLIVTYPVLKTIEKNLLQRLINEAESVTIKAGTLIFRELQKCGGFPFILKGKLRVFKQSLNGRELSLYSVTPGDACVVTTGCLLGNEPYNATGEVKEDVLLIQISPGTFNLLMEVKSFREYIFSLFSKRVVTLMQLVEEVAFHKLDNRLAAYLLKHDKVLKVSHQDLADELGTVREIITRLLNSFADSGYIILKRGIIEVLKEEELQQLISG